MKYFKVVTKNAYIQYVMALNEDDAKNIVLKNSPAKWVISIKEIK
jgi:hypothetical protein